VYVAGRAANESNSSKLSLAQTRLMKIRVESSRAREILRTEKSSSSSVRYYLSWLMNQYIYVDSV
jgi:DNA-binding CsgD family transcriptional regulator